MLLGHLLPQRGSCEMTLVSCFKLYCGCHILFEICIAILKRRDFLEVIAINETRPTGR